MATHISHARIVLFNCPITEWCPRCDEIGDDGDERDDDNNNEVRAVQPERGP